jgi:hypothetical protein
MEIFVNGKKTTLTQKDFVAKGGEAQVFKRGSVAYKIYEDLGKMIPRGKITELSLLKDPKILGPKDIILNSKKQNIGFTMNWLGDDVVALCKLFTNKFRDDNQIENDMIIELVETMKRTQQYIHSNNCLIVDGNELNYLVSNDYTTPYYIDVNAWKTKSYPATAIMPSIRDWSTDHFTELTDWFSFAIVTFQLFIGIHPFKGKHKKFKKNDFRNRTLNNISVFNSEVSLPPTVRDFNLIPSAYKDWYYKIFENGERLEPPQIPGTANKIQVTIQVIQDTNLFEISRLFEVDDQILYHNPQYHVTKTKDKLYLGKTEYRISKGVEVVFTHLEQLPILVKIKDGVAEFKVLQSGYELQTLAIAASHMMIVDNVLYLNYEDNLLEIDFKVIGQKILPTVKSTWKIEKTSSHIFSGVIYQSLLGNTYLTIPRPNISGRSASYSVSVPELNDHKIIESKYQNQICMLITFYKNQYNRVILKFDKTFKNYDFQMINDIDYTPLNFTVLDNGLCVMITEDDAVEIFMNLIDKPSVKRLEDPDINGMMRLVNDGNILKFFRDDTVYSMRMKK